MAGFKFVKNTAGFRGIRMRNNMAVKNSTVLSNGEVVSLVDGRVETFTTAGRAYGVARIPNGGSVTGNSGGTVVCDVEEIYHGDIWEVAQGATADADCDPGSSLDIATGDAVAADSNHDLLVYKQDLAKALLQVIFLKRFIV